MHRLLIVSSLAAVATATVLLLSPPDRGVGNPLADPPVVATDFDGAVSEDPAVIARGSYLVNRVGLCIDCHSPRDERGAFLADRHLQGAPIGFKPLVEMPWATFAPPLAGLKAFPAAHVRRILVTGQRADGSMPRPPMPTYRMEAGDAEAVVAYLKTLP